MTDVQINLPASIISAYERARRHFSEYYYKPRTQWMAGNRVDANLLVLFERFHQTFKYIVDSATLQNITAKKTSREEAYNSLIDIIIFCRGNVADLSFSPTEEVRLPEDVIKFCRFAERAYASYIKTTNHMDSRSLPYFTDVLAHLVYAAESTTSLKSKSESLANAKGCLLRIASNLFEDAILELRREVMWLGYFKSYKPLAFLWNKPLTTAEIILYLLRLNSALAYGYTHKYKIDMAEEYINSMEAACDITAWGSEYMKRCPLRVWAVLGYGVLIGVLGSLVAAAILIILNRT
jgi:hypothetical protein